MPQTQEQPVFSAVAAGRDDLEAYWLPFSGNRQFKTNPRMIVAAEGCYYRDSDGRRVFDAMSGLWCCGFGHSRPEIAEAVNRQLRELDYSPAFQFGHPLVFELANRVKEMTPAGLDYVFFTNSGSESADTALKMAKAYWRAKGQPEKSRLIGRAKGYHGANFGGTGVGGIEPNRAPYGELTPADHLPHTLLPENAFSRGMPEQGAELADALEELVEKHGASRIAAVIVEPFCGSAGVIVPPRGYLQRLRAICDKHDILLIFDEVITGFGRAGGAFGADVFGVVPDLMCLAKGLTNGSVPMGAVVASANIYQAFMETDAPEYLVEFPHGYTYSGHPVACAAGLAALEIFEREKLADRVRDLAPHFEDALHGLRGVRHITDIRNFGLAGALQIDPAPGEPARRPFEIALACWEKGLYVRWAGDTVAMGPPFICEKHQIDEAFNILSDCIAKVT
ncbi:MAG: aspartate aminotransferase family protein [Gammaproteobacteria bacterium]|jgi:beta-alanine--pyruvate transaminase|nr:MAG: aspartate aminotransferase family protein [Gammaproteobacteria bacterium]